MKLSRWIFSTIFGLSMFAIPNIGLTQMVGPKVIPIQAFCGSGGPEDLFMGVMEHGAIPTHSVMLEGLGILYIIQSREPATSIVIHNTKALDGVGMTCMFWHTPHPVITSTAELPPLPEEEKEEEKEEI